MANLDDSTTFRKLGGLLLTAIHDKLERDGQKASNRHVLP